jgi:hypothetical protein
MKRFKSSLLLILFIILTLTGVAYLLFLQFVYPTLTPSHGGGEAVSLNQANNYRYSIPWNAITRLHLTLQTDNIVEVYSNGEYLGNYTNYNFTIEPDDSIFILLKSNYLVTGKITARQEIPPERQTLGITILLVGLVGSGLLAFLIKKS